MAGFNPQSIGKYLADFKTFFSRNRRKRPDEDDTDLEIEEETQENPGDVKMNSGQHRNVYGIRKKIIGGIIAFGVLVFIGSYYISKPDTPTDQPARIPAQRLAPETREPAHTNEERKELSYADLKTLDAGRAKTANAQAAPGADGRPAGSGAANPPGAVTVQQIPTPSLPSAAPDAAYPIPHPNIPPAPVAAGAGAREESPEERAEKELETRYRSAIAFALGGGAGADTAATESTAAGDTSDSNTVQTAARASYDTNSPYILQVGTMIPAMLFSGINTDTPGQVIAQISRDVYDSATETNLLIPSGTRLIGTYQSEGAANGRIAISFATMILPSGAAYNIGGSMVAVDDSGYNGITGKVHRHLDRAFSAGLLTSAIAALGSYASGDSSSQNSFTGGQLMMQGAMSNVLNSVSQIVRDSTSTRPTITIEPGYTFHVYVTQPISFGG
ncbi:MAG: TrbI/VirB10 family protein [Selenomonas massiliensis]